MMYLKGNLLFLFYLILLVTISPNLSIFFFWVYYIGVAIFWPFHDARVGFPLFGYWTSNTELTVKLLEASDHYTDILFFFIPAMLVAKYQNLHQSHL